MYQILEKTKSTSSMKNSPIDNDTLIQLFLENKLNDRELIEFKKRWNSQKEFKASVQDYLILQMSLETCDQMQKNKRSPDRYMRLFLTSIAAAVVLSISVIGYQMYKIPSTKQLVDKQMIDYRLYEYRGDDDKLISPLSKALQAYQNQNSKEAISILKNAVHEHPSYAFVIGDIFLKQQKPDSALFYYDSGSQILPEDPYTNWNRIMALILLKRFDESKESLKEMIIKEKEPYAKKSKEILNHLNSL